MHAVHTVVLIFVLVGLFRIRRYTRRRGLRRPGSPPMASVPHINITTSTKEPPVDETPPGRQDPLWGTALLVVATTQQASPALLEQRLGIDYGRAAALLTAMELEGHIGPARVGSPRSVFIRAEDLAK